MRTYLILLLLIGMATNGIAQPIKLTTAKKIKIAEEKFQQGDTYNALEWYEKAYEDEPDNLAVVERLATIQYEQRDYKQAERWFKRLARRDKNGEYPTAGFYLAQSLKRSGQYPEAIDEFTKFIESSSDDALKTMASNEIVGASMAQEMEENESL
ncbi:MAG: tetratricopeptide repeat protein, partial [Bacteroidota bacterium]